MGLKLERRTASKLVSVNPRPQKHGNENVTALDIQLEGIPLSEEELGVVMQYPQAARRLLIRKKGRPSEPVFGKVACIIPFMHKVEGVEATLFLGRRLLSLSGAKLNKVRVELRQGLIAWHIQIQAIPDLDESHPTMEALLSRLGDQVDVEVTCESYGAQPDLPLEEEEEPEGDDSDEEDSDDETSGLGKAIAANARERARRARET